MAVRYSTRCLSAKTPSKVSLRCFVEMERGVTVTVVAVVVVPVVFAVLERGAQDPYSRPVIECCF